MDLAKKPRSSPDIFCFTGFLFSLPAYFLIVYFVRLGILKDVFQFHQSGFESLSSLGALEEFKQMRNIVYIFFVVVLVILGLRRFGQGVNRVDNTSSLSQVQPQGKNSRLIPQIIVGLLLTTFSYAIAGFILDIVRVVKILFI